MKKQQIIGLIVAAIVFVFVNSCSILVKSYSAQNLVSLNKLNSAFINSSSYNLPNEDFIGVVKVEGAIMNSSTSSLFDTAAYNHKNTLQLINDLQNSPYNKGIILFVNSPGGTVYDSDELYLKLKEYSQNTSRPIWAYMASVACSGGYYISMAADKIYANRNVQTGSIGVIMSMVNYKELFDKLGVKTVIFSSGANKAMGSAGIDMTDEQATIIQSIVDESYEQFLNIVADGRNIDIETLKPIADGRIYTAKQALELNLIDEIQTYENMILQIKNEIGTDITIYNPKTSKGINDIFSAVKQIKPRSDMEIMSEFLNTEGNGVPMYYGFWE